MVLEHLFPEEVIERRTYYAFLLGGVYSIIGILIAKFLFAGDPALPAVGFTSLLLLPEIYKMFSIEEAQQRTEKGWSPLIFWKRNGDFYQVLLFLFIGILVVYSFAAMFLPSFSVNKLFREQVELRGAGFGAAGAATANLTGEAVRGSIFDGNLFWSILKNNWWVMLACFVVSLIAGDGAIFLIVWNASVWGTIFGLTARNAAYFSHTNPLGFFSIITLIVLPHVILEASSYIFAAMAGGLISKGALEEGLDGKKFGKVFAENSFIIFLAIACLLIGALVETVVLQTSDKYSEIIRLSFYALGK